MKHRRQQARLLLTLVVVVLLLELARWGLATQSNRQHQPQNLLELHRDADKLAHALQSHFTSA